MEELTIICEDSVEGVLTGIYEAYEIKRAEGIDTHDRIHLLVSEPKMQRLFTEYRRCVSDAEKAKKVTTTILKICGSSQFRYLCQALATHDEEKADAVYHTVVLAIKYKDMRVLERLADNCVRKVFELSRYTGNEICHMSGFLRFQELENGILYAKIGPENNITGYLAEHFADRMPNENFVIYDDKHHLFAMHERFKQWFLVMNQDLEEEQLVFSEEEGEYQRLFTYFCKKIAITERKNLDLQRNMLPLRFRSYMTEFQKSANSTIK